jgi:hypothetical protein
LFWDRLLGHGSLFMICSLMGVKVGSRIGLCKGVVGFYAVGFPD